MTPVWLFAVVLTATPNPHLAAAEALVAEVRYADAAKTLTLARAAPGNSRETLLRILELQGIVAATLGQAPKARAFFLQLLSLDPARDLPAELPPRVRTPFYEAKGLTAEAALMIVSARSSVGAKGLVLSARLSVDPLALARKVRFHLRSGDGRWTVTDRPAVGGAATLEAGQGRVQWWVELLGERDATLFSAGLEDTPFTEEAAPVAAAAEPAPTVPEAQPAAATPGAVRADVEPKASATSPAAWVCLGGAGLAAAGGLVGGVLSRATHERVNNPPRDAEGFVVGMTQREAADLQGQARTEAVVANVLFGTAVALAGTAAAVWLLSASPKVALIPAPGGLVVAGELP